MKSISRNLSILAMGLLLSQCPLPPDAQAKSPSSRQKLSMAQRKGRANNTVILSMPAVQVPYRSWLPRREKPRMVLLCIHALGLSSKSFDNFGRRMAASGIPTFALDVRGFGEWMKRPEEAHMDFEACLTDVEQGLKNLHRAYPGLPVFLVGESMGGAIAIQAASRYPDQVNGLLAAVPSTTEKARNTAKSTMVVAYRTAESPGEHVDMSPVIVDGATSDPSLRRKIEADPINRMELSKKELAQFEKFMKETHDATPLIERAPTMILVAYKDKLVTPAGSVDLFTEIGSPQKLLVGDGNSEHLMLEEGQMTSEMEWIIKGWLRSKASRTILNEGAR
ncbi:MAG: alpha/beta fold hydrolase [Candidatus Melainabacteria bacterium]|nr:alpha/beta fold hydrolase [Candidatus Melainabacteria bacterium]